MDCNECTRTSCFECGYVYGLAPTVADPPRPRSRARQRARQRRLRRQRMMLLAFFVVAASLITGFSLMKSAPAATDKAEPVAMAALYPLVNYEGTSEEPTPTLVIAETAPEVKAEPSFVPLDIPMETQLQSDINDLCQRYGVPFELIMAMADAESDFRTSVIGSNRDYGLMQIRDINHEWLTEELGVTDFLDPLQNAECGIYMISGFIEKYEDLNLALMAYNCGETGAARLWDKGTYSTDYSRSILAQMDKFLQEREG